MQEDDKRAAAEAAIKEVAAGMLVGLGTGSTAAFVIRALARRVADGLAITTVATSAASAALAGSLGMTVRDFADVTRVDLTIDGVDEIDPALRAIKGAGGAMVREKIVAASSTRMIVVADGSKRVARLGGVKLPVEVLSFARSFVAGRLAALGLSCAVREGFITDSGNPILDCAPGLPSGAEALADAIDRVPGVVGHGLFLKEVDAAYIAEAGIVTRLERAAGRS